MLCKDCIHFDVCKDATVPNPEYKGVQPDKSKECRHFKNKADIVEVVRCKNCTHGVDYCGRTMCGKNARRINDGIVGLTATSPEHFCSYGERSNT